MTFSSSNRKRTPMHPRRVKGGRRLKSTEGLVIGVTTLGRKWMTLFDRSASDLAMKEGLEYARMGQTALIDPKPANIIASVQGRSLRPYKISIQFDAFTNEDWDLIFETIASESKYAATMLHGEILDEVVKIFDDLDLPLIPFDPEHVTYTCSCSEIVQSRSTRPLPQNMPGDQTIPEGTPEVQLDGFGISDHNNADDKTGTQVICKHIISAASLFAEDIDNDSLLAFILRGLTKEEVTERLRLSRRLQTGGGTAQAMQSIDLSSHAEDEAHQQDFWKTGPGLRDVTKDLIEHDPNHPLLRRLGPSPFLENSKFPMAGLLATCFDIVSESMTNEMTSDLKPKQE